MYVFLCNYSGHQWSLVAENAATSQQGWMNMLRRSQSDSKEPV